MQQEPNDEVIALGQFARPLERAFNSSILRVRSWASTLRAMFNGALLLRRASAVPKSDHAHVEKLVRQLAAQKRSLLAFTSTLETEFLAIGDDLQEMTALARTIQFQYDDVLAISDPCKDDSALIVSTRLLQKAEDLILSSHEQYKRLFAVFNDVEAAVANAGDHQDDLQRIWAMLPFIISQFRVQASPFDAATRSCFIILADEVSALLVRVRAEVGQQFQHLNETEVLSQKLAADLINTVVKDKTEVLSVLAVSRGQLGVLERALADSTHAVHGLFETSRGADRGIARLVRALQSQDSARQKIEHICEAMDDLAKNLQDVDSQTMASSEREQSLGAVAEVAFLQRCQIETMFAELEFTAQEIAGGIQDIRTAMEEVVGSASQTGQLALGSHVVGKSVAAIRGILAICQNTIEKTDQVFACITPLTASFSVYTSRIAELAYGVRLSALNAQIYASNLDGGEALSFLSEQARQVSDHSMEEANLLSRSLDGIGDSIEHSHQELESFQALARIEQSAIQSETVLCEAKLHSLQEDMPRRLAEMQPNLARLEDLAKRRANQLNFPLVVAEARRNALDLLDELASCGQRGSPSGGSIAPNQLDDMRARYTMANEQRVHENALHALNQKEGMKQTEVLPVHTSGSIASFTTRPKTQQPAEAIKLEAHSDHLPGGDLGDNIELF